MYANTVLNVYAVKIEQRNKRRYALLYYERIISIIADSKFPSVFFYTTLEKSLKFIIGSLANQPFISLKKSLASRRICFLLEFTEPDIAQKLRFSSFSSKTTLLLILKL